jgi:hypothetical protein
MPWLLSHTQQVSTKNKWTLQEKTHSIPSRGELRTLTLPALPATALKCPTCILLVTPSITQVPRDCGPDVP